MTLKSTDSRMALLDWLKGFAIIAVLFDHLNIVPEWYVVWSVNVFVLVTAFLYSEPGYYFSFRKLVVRISQLIFLNAFAILVIAALNKVSGLPNPESLSSVFFNPYAFFVHNSYLGDIWYIALHLQMLLLFYYGLKNKLFQQPRLAILSAVLVNLFSLLMTHIVLGRLHTIIVTSWLVFIAAGYYGMRPLLRIIKDVPHNRAAAALLSFGVVLSLYAFHIGFPWLFTNNNRAIFLTLPFYAAFIFFLSEMFFISGGSSAGSFLKAGVNLLGRHTLAIYLTHGPFAEIWGRVFPSAFPLVLFLCVASSIAFGTLADRLFIPIKKSPLMRHAIRFLLRFRYRRSGTRWISARKEEDRPKYAKAG